MAFIITLTLHRSERHLGAVESPKILLCRALFSGLFVANSFWGHKNHNFVGACHSNYFECNWALSWTKVWCELNLIFMLVQEQGRAYNGLTLSGSGEETKIQVPQFPLWQIKANCLVYWVHQWMYVLLSQPSHYFVFPSTYHPAFHRHWSLKAAKYSTHNVTVCLTIFGCQWAYEISSNKDLFLPIHCCPALYCF